MAGSRPIRWRRARRGAIAFCTGWWLAGVGLGLAHGLALWGRDHTTVVELLGVPVVAGAFLPGAAPVYLAADLRGVSGLPIGFTGLLLGVVLGLAVWVLLPVLIHTGRERAHAGRGLASPLVAAIPYVAAVAGLVVLYRGERTRGHGPRPATARTIAAVGLAYATGAAVLLAVGLVGLGS